MNKKVKKFLATFIATFFILGIIVALLTPIYLLTSSVMLSKELPSWFLVVNIIIALILFVTIVLLWSIHLYNKQKDNVNEIISHEKETIKKEDSQK